MAGRRKVSLSQDQAVPWTHQPREAPLEAAVTPGAGARVPVARVEATPERARRRLGEGLYRIQRAGAAIAPAEWRRV